MKWHRLLCLFLGGCKMGETQAKGLVRYMECPCCGRRETLFDPRWAE